MPYRDDREALQIRVRELERENEELRQRLERERSLRSELSDAQHERRRHEAREGCVQCGGTLLPVALFAGHDVRAPLPLSISTMRFGSPSGGFTHSAAIHSMACVSCGFIHAFIDMDAAREVQAAQAGPGEPPPQGEGSDPATKGAP